MLPRKPWVSESFGPISKSRKGFLCVSEVSFSSDFCVSESPICLFFFPFGLQKSKFFRVHLGTAYRTELVD